MSELETTVAAETTASQYEIDLLRSGLPKTTFNEAILMFGAILNDSEKLLVKNNDMFVGQPLAIPGCTHYNDKFLVDGTVISVSYDVFCNLSQLSLRYLPHFYRTWNTQYYIDDNLWKVVKKYKESHTIDGFSTNSPGSYNYCEFKIINIHTGVSKNILMHREPKERAFDVLSSKAFQEFAEKNPKLSIIW